MDEATAIIMLLVAVVGVVGTAWWRIQSHVNAVRKEAAEQLANAIKDREAKLQTAQAEAHLAMQQVADLRVHVAETYVSKQGFREMTEQLMRAVNEVNDGVKDLRGRMDRAFDNPQAAQSGRGGKSS